jgi:integrase
MAQIKLTRTAVNRAAAQSSEFVLWDSQLTGFGLRVRPSGTKSYVVLYRAGHGRAGVVRRITLGRPSTSFTPELARKKALAVLGAVAIGNDPADERARLRREMTIAQLCDLYVAEGCDAKRKSTLSTDFGRIERHIKPLIGQKRVGEVTRGDIERFLRDVAIGKTKADVRTGPRGRAIVEGGKGTATRTAGLLGAIFSFAVARELRSDNPVRGVRRYPDHKSERFLCPFELATLGAHLREFEVAGANPMAIATIRLLALTGARKSEIAKLRWTEVDLAHHCLKLGNSKTGPKILVLGAPAQKVLASLPRDENVPWVFPASSSRSDCPKGSPDKPLFGGHKRTAEGYYQGLDKVWRRLRIAAGFPNLRIHDLRHSFASIGLAGGDALSVIGALLGHAHAQTTLRYAHLADDPARMAANRISGAVAAAMDQGATVLPMRKPAA